MMSFSWWLAKATFWAGVTLFAVLGALTQMNTSVQSPEKFILGGFGNACFLGSGLASFVRFLLWLIKPRQKKVELFNERLNEWEELPRH